MAVVLFAPCVLAAAQTAQARISCLSLRFQRGSADFGLSTLDLTTSSSDVNGELAPSFDAPTHFSSFILNYVAFDEPVVGDIAFDVPMADLNQNGFPDFFESSQDAGGTTHGGYIVPGGVDEGTVDARWSRAAGSKDGTCVLTLTSKGFGKLGDFNHAFELIEYTGPLSYTPGTNRVTGTVNLIQTGDPSSRFTGPVEFVKTATNRFNELKLQHEVWSNALAQPLKISNDIDTFDRDQQLGTIYSGFVDFEDGDPATSEADYLTWLLSIDDPNDSNGNGVPDFSDDPPHSEPFPSLSLSLGSTNLLLSIRQGMGSAYEIQRINSLSLTNWTPILSVTLTNNPQIVPLPLPTNGASFWRVRAL